MTQTTILRNFGFQTTGEIEVGNLSAQHPIRHDRKQPSRFTRVGSLRRWLQRRGGPKEFTLPSILFRHTLESQNRELLRISALSITQVVQICIIL
jgi:hypothetical protein